MLKINGGMKCIYHVLATVVIWSNPITSAIDYFWGGNTKATGECFSNTHSE